MKILFLDVDGVLNGHEKLPGSVYCGIRADCMVQLNRVIAATGCKLVISSAWRYQVLLKDMTTRGFENLLCTHGLVCQPATVIDVIRPDCSTDNCDRGDQILEFVNTRDELRGMRKHHIPEMLLGERPPCYHIALWAVVDDDPMGMYLGDDQWRLVKTDGQVGLTASEADRLIEILNGKESR